MLRGCKCVVGWGWIAVVLAVAAPAADTGTEPVSGLVNGSFETAGPEGAAGSPAGWQTLAFGAAPTVRQDPQGARSGRFAVRVSSVNPGMAVLQQSVTIKPNTRYVLTGWVRTANLQPGEKAGLCGTLMVVPAAQPDATKAVRGESHIGDTDWSHIRLTFESPDDGKLLLFCMLCGEGFATGTAWFDDLSLVPADQKHPATETKPATSETPAIRPTSSPTPEPMEMIAMPAIAVTRTELADEPVNPMIYGNFIELGLGRQVDAMWAQMLFNRSFETVTPYKQSVWEWLRRTPNDDLTTEPWYHSGYEENSWYLAEPNNGASFESSQYWGFHHGLQGGIVTNRSADKAALLAQDRIHLRRGITYHFSGMFRHGSQSRANQPSIVIKAALYREKDFTTPIAEETIDGIGSEWCTRSATLAAGEFEGRASFIVSFPPGSEVRVDDFSLVPSDAVSGWRGDAIKATLRVAPRIMRFPGGCFASFYNWRDGIGPLADRRPHESTYWGGLENNDVGTAEFATFCRLVKTQPFICVNMMTGSAAEAADWVAYCNASADHPLGRLRTGHGYSEPFGITYWELDNETYRRFTPAEYAERSAEFAKAMKQVDPTIQVVMVGYWRFHDHLAEMLDIAGPYIDLVTDRSGEEKHLRRVLGILRDYNAKTGRDIRLCNTEWLAPRDNVPATPDALNRDPADLKHAETLQNRQIRWRYAMNAARQLLIFQRLGGRFVFSTFNNLVNTWGQNVIECPKEGAYLSASGRVFELMSRSPAAWPLKLDAYEETKEFAAQAAWDKDRKALVLVVINDRGGPTRIPFDLSALDIKPTTAELSVLHAPSPAAMNTLAEPDTIQRQDKTLTLDGGATFTLESPPYSIVHALLR